MDLQVSVREHPLPRAECNGQNIFRRGTPDCAALDVDGKPVHDALVKTETQ
jgi:hypothetical protein